MAKNKGYLVPGIVKTLDDRDKYPVADVNDVAGARHIVQTDAERLAIPKLRRKIGMECYVAGTGMLYKLTNDPATDSTTVNDWSEEKILTAAEVAQFVTTTNLTSKLSLYALKTDLPDLSQYATLATTSLANYYVKSDTYSKTEADNEFVKKTDLPKFDKIIVALKRPDIISVNYNTDIKDITLPTDIDVTYANGSAATLPVVWEKSTYNKTASGVQILLGTLTLPTGTKNAIVNVIQHIIVGPELHVIDHIIGTVPVPITAEYDAPFDKLGLPTRMQVEYVDGTTGYLDIDWSGAVSSYNPKEVNVQTLTGTFLLPTSVQQPSTPVEPEVEVQARIKPLKIISDASMVMPLVIEGTLFDAAGFPTSNTVTLEDNSTTTLNIKWNKGSYNPFDIGRQYLTGEYVLVDGIVNDDDVTPDIIFEVGTPPDICQVIDPDPVFTGIGVNAANLTLPPSVTVKVLAYDGTITTASANVNWNLNPYNATTEPNGTTYDKNVPGSYYIYGTLVPPAGVTNKTNLDTEIVVNVTAGVTYSVKNDVIETHADLPNGSTLADIVKPSSVTVELVGSDGTTSTDTANVTWSAADTVPAFDGTKAGTYTWYSDPFADTANYTNPGQKRVKLDVTVQAPVTVVYTLETVGQSIGTSATLTEGDTYTEASLNLPNGTNVTVKRSDTQEIKTYIAPIVSWNKSNLDSNDDGVVDSNIASSSPIEIYGSIDLGNIISGVAVKNPNGLTYINKVQVNAAPPTPVTRNTIKGLATPIPEVTNGMTVPFNGNVNDIITQLSTSYPTIDLEYGDGTNPDSIITGIAVTWSADPLADTSSANSTFNVYGNVDLTALENGSTPIYNDLNFIPIKIQVTVGAAPVVKTFESFEYVPASAATVNVAYGTAENDITGLPSTIKVNCVEDGSNNSHTLNITGWTSTNYDPTTPGDYVFTPTINMTSDSNNVDISDHTGNPTVPTVTVTVGSAPVTGTTYLTSEYTVPSDRVTQPDVYMSNYSDDVFAKLKAIANSSGSANIEDAYMGLYDDQTGETDFSKRTVEFRFMGTPVQPIADGVLIPNAEQITNDPSIGTKFQAKLNELGIADGVFGSASDPQYIAGIEIRDDKASSQIIFSQALPNAIIQIRVVDQGTYITDDPNSYL